MRSLCLLPPLNAAAELSTNEIAATLQGAPAEPSSKREREEPQRDKDPKRRRSSPAEGASKREALPLDPSRRREERSDRGHVDRDSGRVRDGGDRQRGEYSKDDYREERNRNRDRRPEEGARDSVSRSRDAWPANRGIDRPQGRSYHPDQGTYQSQSQGVKYMILAWMQSRVVSHMLRGDLPSHLSSEYDQHEPSSYQPRLCRANQCTVRYLACYHLLNEAIPSRLSRWFTF